MGDKVTLSPLTVEDNSSYQNGLNQRLDALADEFDKVIYRDGTQDLTGPQNANSKRIYNLGTPVAMTDAARLQDMHDLIGALRGNSDFALQFQKAEHTVTTATESQFEFAAAALAGYISVFLNGVKLSEDDYSHSGAVVTLATPAVEGDVVSLQGFTTSAVLPTAPGIFYEAPGSTSTPRTLQTILNQTINLADYGYVGDGVTDDTDAWQAGIAAAESLGARTIVVPYGLTGESVVANPIVNGTLPSGLRFVGEGRRTASPEWGDKVLVHYTGTDTCWFINHPAYGSGTDGYWTWQDLAFRCSTATGTMFDFNDTINHTPIDNAGHQYLKDVVFLNCLGYGGHGAGDYADQTGDFIRACKTFSFYADKKTFYRGWRRGIWLKGCDNSTIEAQGFLNAREIMIEYAGASFGNDNRIASRFLGGGPPVTNEDSYHIWDSGFGTQIEHALHEDNLEQRTAFWYLNGYETLLLKPHFGGGKSFRLGPNGRNITMVKPMLTSAPLAGDEPIIDPPSTWDFGNNQQNFRMTIIDASVNIQNMVGAHPRIQFVNSVPSGDVAASRESGQNVLPLIGGLAPKQLVGQAVGGDLGPRVINGAIIVEATGAPDGWAFMLPSEGTGEIFFDMKVGRDLIADTSYKVSFLRKQADTATYVPVIRNVTAATTYATLSGLPADSTWRVHTVTINLAGASAEDLIRFSYGPIAGTSNGTAHLGYVVFEPVSAYIAAPTNEELRDILITHGLMAPS